MPNQKNNTPYNPAYDPWSDKTPGHGQQHAPTFWLVDAGSVPEDDGPVTQDIDVDVAIIGSGYTGLNTAIYLANEFGIKATILEANSVSYGCSTRNGGQAQLASGRLKRSQWVKKYGKQRALNLHAEVQDAMNYFKHMISDIECDADSGGHYYIAHKPRVAEALKKEIKVHNDIFGYESKFIDQQTLRNEVVNDRESFGAMFEPDGISIQPAKLAFGYVKKARQLGVKIHTSSPVSGWETINGVHHLKTPGGVVKARKVAIATGGYTFPKIHKTVKNRLMPVLSNNMVTRVLTQEELHAIGIKTGTPLTDTRVLRHYFRLLPSNRLQIGSRSAIKGKDAPKKIYEDMLIRDLVRKFPILKGIEIEYSWWGWVDVSHDMMPRITQPNPTESVYYALGYGGNGVMYSAQAGRRMAELVAGKTLPKNVPFFDSKLPYPIAFNTIESPLFAPFRRLGQRFLYRWYEYTDERD